MEEEKLNDNWDEDKKKIDLDKLLQNKKLVQPRSLNTFAVYFWNIPTFMVESITLPEYRGYENGKEIWSNITMVLKDVIAPSTSQIVMDVIRIQCFDKKYAIIDILGPLGDIISRWEIRNPKIINANFGEFSYEKNELNKIILEISFDEVVLEF